MSLPIDRERPEVFHRPRPDTWAATPFEVYGRPDVTEQQQDVYDIIQKRTIASFEDFNLPEELKEYILINVVQRFHSANMKNYESHVTRLQQDTSWLSNEEELAYERAKTGHATPFELLDLRHLLGMRSVEVAKLSHPGGREIGQLDAMRQSVDDAVAQHGGIVYGDNAPTKLELANGNVMIMAESDETAFGSIVGLPMLRRRLIGRLPDDTQVFERSLFTLWLGEGSGFDQSIAAAIREVAMLNNPSWSEDIFAVPGFEAAVMDALKNNHYDIAFPLVTTAYAFNTLTGDLIEELEEAKRAARPVDPHTERIRRLSQEAMLGSNQMLFVNGPQSKSN